MLAWHLSEYIVIGSPRSIDHAPPYSVLPTPQGTVPDQGSLADPRGANEEAGQALIALITTRLVDVIRQALTHPNSEIAAST